MCICLPLHAYIVLADQGGGERSLVRERKKLQIKSSINGVFQNAQQVPIIEHQ